MQFIKFVLVTCAWVWGTSAEFGDDGSSLLMMRVNSPAEMQSLTMHTSENYSKKTNIAAALICVSVVLALIVCAFTVDIVLLSFCLGLLIGTIYASVFTLAYDIVMEHGGNAALSGAVISSILMSSCVGSVFGQILDSLINIPYRPSMIFCVSIAGLSVLAFYHLVASPAASAEWLLVPRLIGGFSLGILTNLRYQLMEKMVPPSQVEPATRWETIASTFGMGIAPLMNGVGHHVFQSLHDNSLVAHASESTYFPLLLILPTCSVIANFDIHRESRERARESALSSSENPQQGSITIMITGLLCYSLVHFILQSVEVGTSFLFEVQYGIDPAMNGFAVGAALICVLPTAGALGFWVKAAQTDIITQVLRGRKLICMGPLVCYLFLPFKMPNRFQCLFILIGDVALFGAFAASSGVVTSSILKASVGRCSWGAMSIIMKVCFSLRSFAGPLVRALIVRYKGHHQLVYAVEQFALTACLLLATDFFVSPIVTTETEKITSQAVNLKHKGVLQGKQCNVNLGRMWEFSRLNSSVGILSWILLAVWIPFGILLMTIRLLALIPSIFMYNFAHALGFGQVYIRFVLFFAWGMLVRIRGQEFVDGSTTGLVCLNHPTDGDPVVCFAACPPAALTHIGRNPWRPLGTFFQSIGIPVKMLWTEDGKAKEAIRAHFVDQTRASDSKLVIFPEGMTTNGKALCKFYDFIFTLKVNIVPGSIEFCNPWPVNTDYAGSGVIANMLTTFFLPYVIYNMEFMPEVDVATCGTATEFRAEVRDTISDHLKQPQTEIDHKHKAELKHLYVTGMMGGTAYPDYQSCVVVCLSLYAAPILYLLKLVQIDL